MSILRSQLVSNHYEKNYNMVNLLSTDKTITENQFFDLLISINYTCQARLKLYQYLVIM
jgi:hypothetical protein